MHHDCTRNTPVRSSAGMGTDSADADTRSCCRLLVVDTTKLEFLHVYSPIWVDGSASRKLPQKLIQLLHASAVHMARSEPSSAVSSRYVSLPQTAGYLLAG